MGNLIVSVSLTLQSISRAGERGRTGTDRVERRYWACHGSTARFGEMDRGDAS
jgi:hypothetical protein